MSATLALHFETLDGRFFQFSASCESIQAAFVKPFLEQAFAIPMQDQELVYLDTTSQLLLHDEAILCPWYDKVVLVRPKSRAVKVGIRLYPDRTRVEFVLNSRETFATIKNQIQGRLGIPSMEDAAIFYGTIKCADNANLDQYQIQDNEDLVVLCGNAAEEESSIVVVTLTGKRVEIKTSLFDTVENLKIKIQDRERIPPFQQRIVLQGRCISENEQTRLFENNVREQSTLHLVLRLRGMISSFSFNDMNDPLVRYLMLPESERQNTPFPLKSVQSSFNRSMYDGSFEFTESCGILSRTYRAVIGKFMDFMWSAKQDEAAIDMKLVLPGDILVQVLRPFLARCNDHHTERRTPERVLRKLQCTFLDIGRDSSPKIALRMTKGPTDACINFHYDGSYASYTTQLALNDPEEYEGGKLCFFVKNRLHVLNRPAGSLTGHRPSTLHAVTALTQGVRKSLFVVDRANGLGESDIIVVTAQDVSSFWDSDCASLCSYCFVNFAERNCRGCQKRTVCADCLRTFGDCFLCRIVPNNPRKRKIAEATK